MNELQALSEHPLAVLIHQQSLGQLDLPQPFEQEILLLETHVAGTSHIDYIELTLQHLEPDCQLTLRREPDNLYDEWAIAIYEPDQERIGYIPQRDNIILARLMDAGKDLYARYHHQDQRGDWIKVSIAVYLRD